VNYILSYQSIFRIKIFVLGSLIKSDQSKIARKFSLSRRKVLLIQNSKKFNLITIEIAGLIAEGR